MIQIPDERRPPLTPQLALRVAIIGGVALTLFAIIFFRLWFLQVLDGQSYLAQASVNTLRKVDIPAPRGDILDSGGAILVTSRQALDVQIQPPDLPVPVNASNIYPPIPRADKVIYRRIAHLLNISTKPVRHGCPLAKPELSGVKAPIHRYPLAEIPCLVATSVYQAPYANVTVKPDVNPDIEYYIAENQQSFRGVLVQQVYTRNYPNKDLAAQLFGTIGPINPQEVKERQYRGISEQAIIGQSGLEAEYDKYLRGIDGKQPIQINADNQFQKYLRAQPPVAGQDLKLSLDLKLQHVGQNALQESMSQNASPGGAFVAMNPQNGSVYAMGSLPTFDPNIFTKPVPQSVYDQLNNAASNYPLINRAIQSAGPTGSTFKPITATAALESGNWLVDDTYDDTGQYCFPNDPADCLHNAGHVANGVLKLVDAIRVSDDVFFYHLGALMNDDVPLGGALQTWARKFGIGQATGIDLPDEATGTLPTPAWRAGRNKLEAECDKKKDLSPGGCGLAVYPYEQWTIGDNVNVAVGQGDVQVTPLQLAVAYSALANNGTIVTPHVGEDIQNTQGTVLQRIDPPARRHLNINPLYRQTILEGLRQAASAPGGTSADVFGNFPEQVYGKTGTAQYISNGAEQDYGWYACFVPATATSKPIVVVVWVQQGGFGDTSAAPVARQILSQWFFNKPGQYSAGSSPTL
jgi:penicillin-binding protein 2